MTSRPDVDRLVRRTARPRVGAADRRGVSIFPSVRNRSGIDRHPRARLPGPGRARVAHLTSSRAGSRVCAFVAIVALIGCLGCCSSTPSGPPPTLACPAPIQVVSPDNNPSRSHFRRRSRRVRSPFRRPVRRQRIALRRRHDRRRLLGDRFESGAVSCSFNVTVAPPPHLEKTRTLAFGDSITFGSDGICPFGTSGLRVDAARAAPLVDRRACCGGEPLSRGAAGHVERALHGSVADGVQCRAGGRIRQRVGDQAAIHARPQRAEPGNRAAPGGDQRPSRFRPFTASRQARESGVSSRRCAS